MTAAETEKLINFLETKVSVIKLIIINTDNEDIKEEGHMLLDRFYSIPKEGFSKKEATTLSEDMVNFIFFNK